MPVYRWDQDAGSWHELAAGPRTVDPPAPEPHRCRVAIYNGTTDGADDIFYNALGPALGAGTSYYTHAARVWKPALQRSVYELRSWDQTRIARGYVPFIHLQSVHWNAEAGANVQYYPWAHVADGVHDGVFIELATALKDCPPGTSFSFDGEPEVRLEAGTHQPVPNPNSPVTWPAGWPQNGDGLNTPETYAAAQRHIYEVMHPIAPNLDYRFWFAGHDRSAYMRRFWPGSDVVTSIGCDPYVWKHNPAYTTPYAKFQPVISWARANLDPDLPIGISETGIDTTHPEAALIAFWENMPEAVRVLELSFLTYYNRSNWQITPTSRPAVWAAYVDAMLEIAEV